MASIYLEQFVKILESLLPYFSIFLVAISLLVILKLFEHNIYRYKNFLNMYYIFLILFILDILINYFFPVDFYFIYLLLIVYTAVIYYVYLVTKRYGLLPVEVIMFMELVASGFIVYAVVPIIFACIFLGLVNGLVALYIMSIFAIIMFLINIVNCLKMGIDFLEVLHYVLGIILFIVIFIISFYTGQALYFNVHKWYFYSILFVGIIEFASHWPTIIQAPQYTGFKKWFWILITSVLILTSLMHA